MNLLLKYHFILEKNNLAEKSVKISSIQNSEALIFKQKTEIVKR